MNCPSDIQDTVSGNVVLIFLLLQKLNMKNIFFSDEFSVYNKGRITITSKSWLRMCICYRCKILNLHRNNLTSIRQLPKVPEIQHLCLSENSISSLGELSLLRSTPLRSLTLKHNPCQFLEDYRSRWEEYRDKLCFFKLYPFEKKVCVSMLLNGVLITKII